MHICIPISEDRGLESPVCHHLAAAPLFVIADREGAALRVVANPPRPRVAGVCAPLVALEGERYEVMVVRGIGGGAMTKLTGAGVRVCVTDDTTVAAVLAAARAGTLRDMAAEDARCNH